MRRTTLVIDEEQLAKAKTILGTKGINDPVAAAFAEIVAVDQRKKLVERLIAMDGRAPLHAAGTSPGATDGR